MLALFSGLALAGGGHLPVEGFTTALHQTAHLSDARLAFRGWIEHEGQRTRTWHLWLRTADRGRSLSLHPRADVAVCRV